MASFESFLSLETRLDEGNTMRQQWNDNDVNQREEGDVDEPWMSADFSQLNRRQQNCEIYRVWLLLAIQPFTQHYSLHYCRWWLQQF